MIAIDAMGGDFAPQAVVKGAYRAAKKGVSVALFGKEAQLRSILDAVDPVWERLSITIVSCSDTIDMGEEPVRAVRMKPDSSLVRALKAASLGQAVAVVTAGNSGAALVGGSLIFGKVSGVSRPAIGSFIPTLGAPVFCLDLGANSDVKAEQLRQFAIMGSLFVSQQRGGTPRVALLSNGSEPYKGSYVVKEAFSLLQHEKRITFVGNIEPADVLQGGVDVLVSDGFAGNVMLKSIEGTVKALRALIRNDVSSSFFKKVSGWCMRPFLRSVFASVDYAKQGGALLLGLRKPLIIAHGCSDEIAIENGILFAKKVAGNGLIDTFNRELEERLTVMQVRTDSVVEAPNFHVEYEL